MIDYLLEDLLLLLMFIIYVFIYIMVVFSQILVFDISGCWCFN